MGNNVTTTPVETLKINETNDDFEDNNDSNDNTVGNNIYDIHNVINGINSNDFTIEKQIQYQEASKEDYSDQWTFYQQNYLGISTDQNFIDENNLSINERIEILNSVPDFDDEGKDVLNDIKDTKPLNGLSAGVIVPKMISNPVLDKGLPLLRRNIDDNNYIKEIDDMESIGSGSKLTLNDVKSDTEDVIQELNELNLDLDDNTDKYPINFRKRGQSWSNWENNALVDLNAESSLSSFSRPASINESQPSNMKGIKTKSYTAPETRGREDNAIEWLAKQQGLEMGSGLDIETKQKPIESTKSRNPLRQSSTFEIRDTMSTSSSVNETQLKYDDLDQQIISSIENDYIR